MEYYVIGEDKSSAPAYTKTEVYNTKQVDSMVDGINGSLANKAGKEALSALENAVGNKLDSSVIHKYVPKTTTINGMELSGPITLDYNSVGAAQAAHNHDDIYYRKENINSKIDTINSSIDNIIQSVNSRPIPAFYTVTTATEREYVNEVWGWTARIPHLELNQIAFVDVKAFCGNSSAGYYWDEGDRGAIKTRGDEKCVVFDLSRRLILNLSYNAVVDYDMDTNDGYIQAQYIVFRTA